MNTANSTFQGQYLFGGSNTQTAPFQVLAQRSRPLHRRPVSDQFERRRRGLSLPNNIRRHHRLRCDLHARRFRSRPGTHDPNQLVRPQQRAAAFRPARFRSPSTTGLPYTETVDLSHAADDRRRPAADRKRLSARRPDSRHRLRLAARCAPDHSLVGNGRRLRYQRRQNRRRLGIASAAAASITGEQPQPASSRSRRLCPRSTAERGSTRPTAWSSATARLSTR